MMPVVHSMENEEREKNIWIIEANGQLHAIKALPSITIVSFLAKVRNKLKLPEETVIQAFLTDNILGVHETLKDKGTEASPIRVRFIKTDEGKSKLKKLGFHESSKRSKGKEG